jgi:glycosyltransferase involved in cell wall biosynthesis
VRVVRNGPQASTVVPGPSTRPGPLSDPRLVYVGALSAHDGVLALADVLALVVGRHGLHGAALEVVGDGDARPALEAALARAGVRERVTFTGWIASAAVPDHVRAADICVDPAPGSQLNHHSTMIKIAEYMAAGKPVVARDLVETRRTLGEAGVLVSSPGAEGLAAACAELAADPARRAELGGRALERVHGLTWEHSERRLLAAYRDLEGPAGTRP